MLEEIIATGGVAITLLYSFRFIALVVNSWVLKESVECSSQTGPEKFLVLYLRHILLVGAVR